LAIKFGEKIFTEHIERIFMAYLTNTAAAVRKKGVEKVGLFVKNISIDSKGTSVWVE
jgi:hypothetical protein